MHLQVLSSSRLWETPGSISLFTPITTDNFFQAASASFFCNDATYRISICTNVGCNANNPESEKINEEFP